MALTVYSGSLPDRANDTPTAFADNVFDYQIWIDASFVTELNTELDWINTQLTTMVGYRDTTEGYMNTTFGYMNTTETYKNDAETAANSAASSLSSLTNNKGAWSGLSGALNIPASVNHSGYVWVLNVDLADVTLSEPTFSNSDWTHVEEDLTPAVTEKTISFTFGTSGVVERVNTTAGVITGTLPISPVHGTTVRFADVNTQFSTNAFTVARNGETIMGLAEDMEVATDNVSITLMYIEDDWRLL